MRRSAAAALCLGFAVLSGCRRQVAPVSDLTITHEVSPRPPRVGPTTITLKLTDAARKPVSGARITVEGNMSHAGMAPVIADAHEVERGSYRANVELTMAGDWVIIAHVSLADGRKLDHQFALNGVGSS